MKVRSGFVSNSSSSSFCIFGIFVEGVDEMKRLGYSPEFDEAEYRKMNEIPDGSPLDELEIDDATRGSLYGDTGKKKLEVYGGYDYESGYYIGLSLDKMKDTETKAQFKQRTLERIQKLFPKAKSVKLYEGEYQC